MKGSRLDRSTAPTRDINRQADGLRDARLVGSWGGWGVNNIRLGSLDAGESAECDVAGKAFVTQTVFRLEDLFSEVRSWFSLPHRAIDRSFTWGNCWSNASVCCINGLSGLARPSCDFASATLNSEKSNTYDSNVTQPIIRSKARSRTAAARKPATGPTAVESMAASRATTARPSERVSASAAPSVQHLRVDEGSEGQRLDNFLIKQLKGVPKTHVYRVIRSGEVRVNKGRAAADTRLVMGDDIRVPPVRMAARAGEVVASAAPAREFPVVYEDDFLLAIDKPAGVAVHGGSGVSSGVIEQLRQARPQARFLELVHRLDKETSGLLLIAKKRSALLGLQEQFRQRSSDRPMAKIYSALVAGDWPERNKVIDQALHKYLDGAGERRVRVVAADHADGRRAITLVRVLRRLPGFSLLDVSLKTGRTHQIRVHLAGAGFVIVGDDKYGDFALNKSMARGAAVAGCRFDRMFLHARKLSLLHPASGEPMELEAGLPPECEALLQALAPAADGEKSQ